MVHDFGIAKGKQKADPKCRLKTWTWEFCISMNEGEGILRGKSFFFPPQKKVAFWRGGTEILPATHAELDQSCYLRDVKCFVSPIVLFR
jgi:hypothetical protein